MTALHMGTSELIMPAMAEEICCWEIGASKKGMVVQTIPRVAIRPQSTRSIGRREAGSTASTADPSTTLIQVITAGSSDSRPIAMKRYEEPQMTATATSNNHSIHPNGPLMVPAAVEKMGDRPDRPRELGIRRIG